jgi:23S rRNA (guanine745-N1)-methyltransferase
VLALLKPLQAQTALDAGCGEGYYTSALTALAPEVIGLDIAKPAIRLAAKRFRGITWLVGSAALLPLAEASVDVVCSLFSQLQIAEMQRVLKPGGHVLAVTPAPDHLWSVRQALFDEVQAHQPDKFLAGFEGAFELGARRESRFGISLTQQTLRQLLLMTPYAWKARPDRRAALEAQDSFATQAAFSLMLWRKL